MLTIRSVVCTVIVILPLLSALPQDSTAHDASALKTGALELPAGLCPSEPIWGLPPAGDAIHALPPLPALDGCCRYLPPNTYLGIAAAFDGQVALELGGNEVELIDGASGESMWSAEVGWPPKHIGWDHLFAESADGGDLVALKLSDGTVEWRAQGCIPLGISGRSVWAAFQENTLGIADPHSPSTLLQIEQKSGDFQKVNALEGRVTFSSVEDVGGVYMSCLMHDRLLVTGAPMTLETSIDLSAVGEWDGACSGMSRTRHYVLHYRKAADDKEGQVLETLLSCYDGLGALTWSREQRINVGGFAPDRLSCMGEVVLASSDWGWGSLIFSASDGSFLKRSHLSSPQVVLGEMKLKTGSTSRKHGLRMMQASFTCWMTSPWKLRPYLAQLSSIYMTMSPITTLCICCTSMTMDRRMAIQAWHCSCFRWRMVSRGQASCGRQTFPRITDKWQANSLTTRIRWLMRN